MSKQKIRDVSGKVIGEIDENTKSLFETLKDIKKDINKAFENLPEGHIPGYNFMGPFTKNDDRLSLNWKGKRQQLDYYLPTNREDYISFKHDLGYYAPSNVVRSYFDLEMLKAITKSKSARIEKIGAYGGIGLAYLRRLTEELGYSGLYLIASKDAFNSTLGYVSRVMNDPTLSTSSALLHSFVYPSVLFGSGFLGRPIKHLADGINKIYSLFGETKQYKEIKDPLNKVMEKYDKYLESVGSFKKEEKQKPPKPKDKLEKLLYSIPLPDLEREKFKLKENIDKEKSTKLYKEFYDEFNEYKKKVNDVFKNQEGFKPYEIIPLNEDNLFLVGDPYKMPEEEDIIKKDVDELMLKLLKDFKTTETGATLKDLEDAIDKLTKKKELKEEVIKVLESKILKPFETPAEDKEEITPPTPTPVPKPAPKPAPIPEGFDFFKKYFKKLQEEETKKVLEGEIETPLETPIQLNVPTDADFFKSLQQQQ